MPGVSFTQSTDSSSSRNHFQPGKYKKHIQELLKNEARALCKLYAQPYAQTDSRHHLLLKVFREDIDFEANYSTKYIYFEITEEDNLYTIECFNEEDIEEEEFKQIRTSTGAKVDIAKILLELAKEKSSGRISEEEDNSQKPKTNPEDNSAMMDTMLILQRSILDMMANMQATNDGNTKATQDLVAAQMKVLEMNAEAKNNKIFLPNPKNIKYEEEDGTEHFLNKIQAFCIGNKISSDDNKIRFAINGLSATKRGARLVQLCKGDDMTSWEKFAAKLSLIDGQSKQNYLIKFNNYTRKPDENASILMAKLIEYYRKSMGYNEDTELIMQDKVAIKNRFLGALEPILRKMLNEQLTTMEYNQKDISTELDTLAARTMRMEENCQIGIHAPKSSINNLSTLYGQYSTSNQNFTQESEIVNLLKQQQRENQRRFDKIEKNYKNYQNQVQKWKPKHETRKFNTSTQKPTFRKYSPEVLKSAKGYCIFFMEGKCNRDNCAYKHDNIPEDIKRDINRKLNN